jgi:ABC-type transport system substrate-binding protein
MSATVGRGSFDPGGQVTCHPGRTSSPLRPGLKFSATTPVALANYSNPELDRLLEHARETVDTEKRSRTTAFRHFRMSC